MQPSQRAKNCNPMGDVKHTHHLIPKRHHLNACPLWPEGCRRAIRYSVASTHPSVSVAVNAQPSRPTQLKRNSAKQIYQEHQNINDAAAAHVPAVTRRVGTSWRLPTRSCTYLRAFHACRSLSNPVWYQ